MKKLKNGFYFFTSERASNKAIAQYINGEWFSINEVGPITLEELNRRGWDLEKRVKGQKLK
ncbi:hypothetical protein EVB81_189 [Rhizobium phage RHph_I46]|uniref:Uncharacterized protein n=1 Tax=Rhizobium phage RHph_I1_9 TaxID=2509729 RepID=A0A7S5RIN9_9CAUD|nr:hypothetical protein PP936_gp187 [Rhizobium phage RHph_I1_9]QIG69758.1 hypothetical protein EVB81_189 [Rhizobium phage RHph_I46]QIG71039.1 hypothetical protein EVB92_189 [Rhizobium phage RHph_I9]QIG73624.1 hypothetical protein EVC04_187 [Rhizobium phage RHph_I1_9]QIG76378.1 hypothetical protein EVC25_189 [Rhizobium phage RHph_I34]